MSGSDAYTEDGLTRFNMRRSVLLGLPAAFAVTACAASSAQSTLNLTPDAPVWQTLPATPRLGRIDRSGILETGGAAIWWAEFNRRGAGTPVLLLHGGLANSNYFGEIIPALVQSGRRVFVMDTRGHGRSTASDEPMSYRLFGRDVIALADHLSIEALDIVGWSDGANTGLNLVIHDRTRVRRLFAFAGNADASALIPGFDETPAFQAYIQRSQSEYAALSPTPDRYDAMLAQIGAMWAVEPNYSREMLESVATPVTIAHATYDEGISRLHAVYLSDVIANSNLVMLPNVSHFAMLQNPQQFSRAVLDFLDFR